VHRASSKSSADLVVHFGDLPPDAASIAGGKGASLGRMAAAGLPVPPGFVIAAGAFQMVLETCGGSDLIRDVMATLDVDDTAAVAEVAERVRGLIVATPVPASLDHAIRAAHANLSNGELVAVRSSAVCEDGTTASFAGQQETYLNVRGTDDVLRRVQECWASFFSPRALFYRARKAVLHDTRMAVVVQEMIQPDKSGVMFTVDPIRNRRDCMVIEGAAGLGDAIVSGEITPDHYVVSRDDGSIVDEYIPDAQRGRVLEPAELAGLRDLGIKL
jgi:pyruvate,water dikinase